MQDTQTVEFSTFALCNCCLISSCVTVRVESVSPSWQECFIWLPPKCRREIFIAFPSCPATHRPLFPVCITHAAMLVMPTACPAAALGHIISGSHEAQSGATTSLHLPVSRDQHDKHLLLVCSLVPSPSSCVQTDVCFCLNKKNITLLLVFLTYRSFKWMSWSLYSGSEVHEVWGKKQLKR